MRGSRGSGAVSHAIIRRKAPRHSKNSAVATPRTRYRPLGVFIHRHVPVTPSPLGAGGRCYRTWLLSHSREAYSGTNKPLLICR